jgi:cbb3-type cytochrome oxidase maturation protein
MKILLLLIFVSLVLVLLAVAFFIFSVRNEDFDHALQLSLKPLEEDGL